MINFVIKMDKSSNCSSPHNSNFKYQHTLLLYLVYEGYKCGALNSEEKIKMKELILMKHPVIYVVLRKYEENGQVESFWLLLKELINNTSYEIDSNQSESYHKLSEEESDKSTRGGNCLSSTFDVSEGDQYQLSSPSDAALIRQKKKKRVIKNVEKEFKEKSEEEIKESQSVTVNKTTSFKSLVKQCDQGCSPKVTVKKRYNNEDEDGFY
jgi:DNA-binding PadR family transcriptional regulator